MNLNKNIVTIVFNYFSTRFSERECNIVFGEAFGSQLWVSYVNVYKKNPYLWWMGELTDEWRNDITIRAQKLSLNNDCKDEMDAIVAISEWPIRKSWDMLIDEMSEHVNERFDIIDTGLEDVYHDFPMYNGMYTTKILSAEYDGMDIKVYGMYKNEEIIDYIHFSCKNTYKTLILHKSFKQYLSQK